MSGETFDAAEFGARVLAAMGDQTCREVAPKIGISAATLNRVTRGNVPDLLTYFALCRWLSTPQPVRMTTQQDSVDVERLRAALRKSHSFGIGHASDGKHVTLNFRTRADRDAFLDAHVAALTLPITQRDEQDTMAWFGSQRRLSLFFYSPMYGDDDDQSEEWRVQRESGPINDREWDTVGCGDTPLAAIRAARLSIEQGDQDGGQG